MIFLASSEKISPRRMIGTGPRPAENPRHTRHREGSGIQLTSAKSLKEKKIPTPTRPIVIKTKEVIRRNTLPNRSINRTVDNVANACTVPIMTVASDGSIAIPDSMNIVVA